MSIYLEYITQQHGSTSWEYIEDDYFQIILICAEVSRFLCYVFLQKELGDANSV